MFVVRLIGIRRILSESESDEPPAWVVPSLERGIMLVVAMDCAAWYTGRMFSCTYLGIDNVAHFAIMTFCSLEPLRTLTSEV